MKAISGNALRLRLRRGWLCAHQCRRFNAEGISQLPDRQEVSGLIRLGLNARDCAAPHAAAFREFCLRPQLLDTQRPQPRQQLTSSHKYHYRHCAGRVREQRSQRSLLVRYMPRYATIYTVR